MLTAGDGPQGVEVQWRPNNGRCGCRGRGQRQVRDGGGGYRRSSRRSLGTHPGHNKTNKGLETLQASSLLGVRFCHEPCIEHKSMLSINGNVRDKIAAQKLFVATAQAMSTSRCDTEVGERTYMCLISVTRPRIIAPGTSSRDRCVRRRCAGRSSMWSGCSHRSTGVGLLSHASLSGISADLSCHRLRSNVCNPEQLSILSFARTICC